MNYRKKLIEVALPLEAINKASIQERGSKLGFPEHPDFASTSVNYSITELVGNEEVILQRRYFCALTV